jgi:hypothetical protein
MRGSREVRCLVVASGLVAALTPASARAAADDHAYQTWAAAFLHGPIKGHVWLWTDAQLRLYETFEPSAILLRPGLSWQAWPNVFLTAGYGWTPSFARPGDRLQFTDEHRAWEQILWTPSDDETGVAAMLRGRLEQRLRPDTPKGTGARGRVMWRGSVPLSKRLPVTFVLWDELFIGINKTLWGQRPGVDQNRIFAGFGWQIRPKIVRVEVGYTNVWLVRQGPDPINHAIAINTFIGWNPPKRRDRGAPRRTE